MDLTGGPYTGKMHASGAHLFGILIVVIALLSGGCTGMADRYFKGSVDDDQGAIHLSGMKEQVLVMRDDYGIPYIDARNMEDMAFAIGYVHASDRFTQMIGFKLAAQGRLAEMAGPLALDLDVYMRTIGLTHIAQAMFQKVSPRNRDLLQCYSNGVNAWMERHRDSMPPGIALSDYSPEPWKPVDSVSIFCLVNLALSFNLNEECSTLNVARAIGADKTAWLLPIYPDEPLPFAEAAKLRGVNLDQAAAAAQTLDPVQRLTSDLGFSGNAASNNWAISKDRAAGAASILANDTHLMLSMPSMWNIMHVRCGSYDVAGISIAGVPAIVAGYNGHIAWGMTMVMADNQDLFLEKIRREGAKTLYLHKGQWLETKDRQEVFRVKGADQVTFTVRETCHGPLLNDAIRKEPQNLFQPMPVSSAFGIALSWASVSADEDLDNFFSISLASSVDEAFPGMKRIRAIPLNMVFADKENIGWQVTGNYPLRAKGSGLIPSPGWTGEYDWTGLMDPSLLPHAKNPAEGFIGTANNRTVPKDFPHVLSSSWYWPERAERIAMMASATNRHTLQTSMDMQLDAQSLYAPKLRDALLKGGLAGDIRKEISAWDNPSDREKATSALTVLEGFDGDMAPGSKGAALVSAFLDRATRNIFLDEMGPEDSRTWKSFLVINNESYNATCDHLVVRGDESPFWDDVTTPIRETKASIVARSLLHAWQLLEKDLGRDVAAWTWGGLHTYAWETEAYRLIPSMGFLERTVMNMLRPYFNRGPHPAPGDYFTLNVSGYMMGKDFNTWLIPAMRLIVDFSLEEPMFMVNSSGQSDNPSSPHYEDGITAWREGKYIPMPFGSEAVRARYHRVLTLTP